MDATNPTEAQLKRKTNEQLKAICKERRLTGYGKLNKAALISKILGYAKGTATDCLPPTDRPSSSLNPRQITPLESCTSSTAAPLHIDHDDPEHYRSTATSRSPEDISTLLPAIVHPSSEQHRVALSDICNDVPVSAPSAKLPSSRQLAHTLPIVGDKRPADPTPTGRQKKRPNTTNNNGIDCSHPASSVALSTATTTAAVANYARAALPEMKASVQPPSPAISIASIMRPAKRFVPLLALKPAQRKPVSSDNVPGQTSAELSLSCSESPLDFEILTCSPLSPATLPPRLSRRKYVFVFALALSSVAYEDLPNCALVSRLFRYAVYMSATSRLIRNFPGKRLERVTRQHSPHSTNMWPYLRLRDRELVSRKSKFVSSFLGRYFNNECVIAECLWTSPDYEKQVTIAVRTLLTCLFFAISVGGKNSTSGTIVNAQEVVKSELWRVTLRDTVFGLDQDHYVLEATCEIIGGPALSPLVTCDASGVKPSPLEYPVRSDWSSYIQDRMSSAGSRCMPSLMDLLNWTNHEEYDRGISKVWLSRMQGEQESGRAKKVVAERYVLACVVANSVSGKWMTTSDMAQDFAGKYGDIAASRHHRPSRVNLFLPAHHHVESVHFTTTNRKPLHPAVAAVQTPAREYYILKDNGMQIGCEEEGIADVWRQIVGCTERGEAL